MEFGKFWDKEMRNNTLYNIKEIEFFIIKEHNSDRSILNQLKSFLTMFSDINVNNEKQFGYEEDGEKIIVSIKFPYKDLEKPVKDYLNLLEEYGYLEWV